MTTTRKTCHLSKTKMTQVIWVDSRMRVSGTDSDFEVALRESVHLSDARVRVDKLTFVDSRPMRANTCTSVRQTTGCPT